MSRPGILWPRIMAALHQTCVAMVCTPPITGASLLVRKIPTNRHLLSCYFLPTVPTGRGPRYAVEHLDVLGVKSSSQRDERTGSSLRASISSVSRSFPNIRMMEDKYLTTRVRCYSAASDAQDGNTLPAREASVTEGGSGMQDSSLQSVCIDSGSQEDAQSSSSSSEVDDEGASAVDSVAKNDTEFETANGLHSAEEEADVNHNEASGSSEVSSQSVSDKDTIETEETNGNTSKEHPWKFWTIFLSQLQQQGYYPAAAETVGEVNSDYSIIKRAILNFGRDRDDIYEQLAAEDVTQLGTAGCPDVERKAVNAAKRLRKRIGVEETQVCSLCSLRVHCTRVNAQVGTDEQVSTPEVVRLIMGYARTAGAGVVALPETTTAVCERLVEAMVLHSQTQRDPARPRLATSVPVPPKPKLEGGRSVEDRQERGLMWRVPTERQAGRRTWEEGKARFGDWNCSKCNFSNFGRNTLCRQCNAEGPGGAANRAPPSWSRPGEGSRKMGDSRMKPSWDAPSPRSISKGKGFEEWTPTFTAIPEQGDGGGWGEADQTDRSEGGRGGRGRIGDGGEAGRSDIWRAGGESPSGQPRLRERGGDEYGGVSQDRYPRTGGRQEERSGRWTPDRETERGSRGGWGRGQGQGTERVRGDRGGGGRVVQTSRNYVAPAQNNKSGGEKSSDAPGRQRDIWDEYSEDQR